MEKEKSKPRKRWVTDWPNRLNLKILRQSCPQNNQYAPDCDYIKEVKALDADSFIKNLKKLMNTPQDWWLADFGYYDLLFVHLAWHSAGSYRIYDRRGETKNGSIRFLPRINWPDNIGLDKAIRLLWPIKKKYGKKLSWANLIILAGTVAFEDMGVKILGLGREDIFEPDESPDWKPEEKMLTSKRGKKDNLERPYAATEMCLIYINPEDTGGNPDSKVALIAGGHAFGKCHGAASDKYLGPDPISSLIEKQGLGWEFEYKSGKGNDAFTSGFEVVWSITPTRWANYYKFLFEYDLELTKSSAGKYQWVAKNTPVKKELPEEIFTLMELYPQPAGRRPSVEYAPVPYREGGKKKAE